ncbi:MAG: SAVED domain-containing protein [Thermoanaerobaculia bacterium]|nr:SAVED domain-containing protein [Thermoanaerobaculia bacterium]
MVGEYAHIIADSPDGARGVAGESERLAKDPSNLMLACFDCHDRIDRRGKQNPYTNEQLQEMKREHEERIEIVYSATGVKLSLPIVMTFPVGPHIPVVELDDVHHAMLANSRHTRFPLGRGVRINKSDFDLLDGDAAFWARAQRALEDMYERRIHPELSEASHLTIAAFAPIPMLMKLGALVGDKVEASVLDLPSERWLWDTREHCPTPSFCFNVPAALPPEVSVAISISNLVNLPDDSRLSVEFRAEDPGRGIIRTESHMAEFRRTFNQFLMSLIRAGAQVLHLYPATPLGASVEVGRVLLPKTLRQVHVYDWQDGAWLPALRLK